MSDVESLRRYADLSPDEQAQVKAVITALQAIQGTASLGHIGALGAFYEIQDALADLEGVLVMLGAAPVPIWINSGERIKLLGAWIMRERQLAQSSLVWRQGQAA